MSSQQHPQYYQHYPQQLTDSNHHIQRVNINNNDYISARNSVNHFGPADAEQLQRNNNRKRRMPASGDGDENEAYSGDYYQNQQQFAGRELLLTEERTCRHSFKRLRLQSSEESSQSESANNENTNNNGYRQQWSTSIVEGGLASPTYAQDQPHQHQSLLPQQSQPQLQQHYAYNHSQHHHRYQQPPGQPTNSSSELRNAADKDYSKVNNFLGLMHQQRQQRMLRAAPVAAAEWDGTRHSDSGVRQQQQHQSDNAMGMSGNPQQQLQSHKPHGRYSIHLPSNSNIM